jgi:TRAP-type C4-dicarboxylate transport system substrate-binding protein
MGANPISMNWSEVFTALQQGTIDGQENPIVNTFIPNRIYEVQKFISIWGYSYDGYLLNTNTKLFDALSDADKAIVQEAALASAQKQKDIIRAGFEDGKRLLEEEGMKVYTLTPDELSIFKKAAAPVVEKYINEFGGEEFVNKLIRIAQ